MSVEYRSVLKIRTYNLFDVLIEGYQIYENNFQFVREFHYFI